MTVRTRPTFYSIAALTSDVPADEPVAMTEDTVYLDLLRHLAHDGDFVGVVDDAGTVLQVAYVLESKAYWIEIPDPARGGSHGCQLSLEQTTAVFENLPTRFSKTMVDGMEFTSWS